MTKFFKRLAIFIVVILIAIIGAYFFLVDGLIKSQLERQGSLALQTPLAIGEVTFHLFPTSLTLHNVEVGNTRLPTHNLIQAESLSLPLSLRDLFANKLIVENMDVRGLRFNSLRAQAGVSVPTTIPSATNSSQLRETLQRVQQTLNHPLASNTIDPNASISGAVLAEQFKPLFTQITTALSTLALPSSNNFGDWQILVKRVNIDGALDFAANSNATSSTLKFIGTIDNVTPQPVLFNTVTHFDLHNAPDESATLQATGSLDKRKLTQATLRFDVTKFQLTQWPLSNDAELKIIIVSADVDVQAMLTLTGNQFDLNALMHFQKANFDIASGDNEVARVVADVWRRADAFDINLQANGDVQNPVVKMNSSLDVPLTNALRQSQPAPAFPSATFPSPSTLPTAP